MKAQGLDYGRDKPNPFIDLPPITCTTKVETMGGKIYYEHCSRCNGYPQLGQGKLPPLKPMTFEHPHQRELIKGISGGILPVPTADGKTIIAACSCQVGDYAMNRYRIPRYDALPGSSPTDTKHDLVRMIAEKNLTKDAAETTP